METPGRDLASPGAPFPGWEMGSFTLPCATPLWGSPNPFLPSLPQPWTSHLPHHQPLRVSEGGLKGSGSVQLLAFSRAGIICIHRSIFPAEAGQGDSRSCGKSVGSTALQQTGLGCEWGQGSDQLHAEGQESLQPPHLISTKKNTRRAKFLGENRQAQPLNSEDEQEGPDCAPRLLSTSSPP